MKKWIATILLLAAMLSLLTACGEKRAVTCDGCGKEILVDADSNTTDEWILYCDECAENITIEDAELGDIID